MLNHCNSDTVCNNSVSKTTNNNFPDNRNNIINVLKSVKKMYSVFKPSVIQKT